MLRMRALLFRTAAGLLTRFFPTPPNVHRFSLVLKLYQRHRPRPRQIESANRYRARKRVIARNVVKGALVVLVIVAVSAVVHAYHRRRRIRRWMRGRVGWMWKALRVERGRELRGEGLGMGKGYAGVLGGAE
ncbi:hypothetical protein BU16DRAFT_387669 [Lophium mytilinum]|uniref:Transmembrane protein n=1 Tax=Lophium mytilinum TaxID=390894 RepID=A0A6A6QT41_9PEZI|nr:hypothetical protein BU16DRAFT_387669 [Lophium mytilinum]